MVDIVTNIVQRLSENGGAIYYSLDTKKMYAHSSTEIPEGLLADIEINKHALLIAISGDSAYQIPDGGNNNGGDIGNYDFGGLAELLKTETKKVLPGDKITEESLNRHKYAFDVKFDALAKLAEIISKAI